MLQLLVVAAAIGIAALKVGAKAEPFLQFNASLLAIVQKVLWWIIRLAPIGTAALIANAVATYGWDAIGSLGWFTAAVYVGLAIVFFVVYPVLIRAHGLSVRAFYSGVWPATQLGFVSRSSIGTLPLTERVTERNLASPASTRRSPCRSGRPPRWTAAPRSIPRSQRSSSPSSTVCLCRSPTTS